MDPRLLALASKCIIVASPDGTIYFINARRRELLWSYKMPREYPDYKIYKAWQNNKDNNFMDAHVDVDEFGEIRLSYHNKSGPPKVIPLISSKQVKTDISSYFGEGFKFKKFNFVDGKSVKLDYEQGKPVVEGLQGIVDIKEIEYEISSIDEWSLHFSMYQARFFFDDCDLPIHVYHTHELKAFSDLCCTIMGVHEGVHEGVHYESMEYEMWIQENMTLETVEIEKNPMNTTYNNMFCGLRSNSIPVIVISFRKDDVISLKVRTFWSAKHDKFLIFYGVRSSGDDYHFIFEQCKYTLYEYLRTVVSERGRVMRELVDGLIYLDEQGLCHTNLNPWNVMVTDHGSLKISGFDLKPKPYGDLSYLGKLIQFCYSDSIDPRQHFTVEMYYKKKIMASRSPWACGAKDIALQLQRQGQNRESSPSIYDVSRHLWLWNSDKCIAFYIAATELLKHTSSNRKLSDRMMRERWNIFGINETKTWERPVLLRIAENRSDYLGIEDDYNYTHPWDLLRFIRNTLCHLSSVLKHLEPLDREWLGLNDSDVELKFRSEFPQFFTGLYDFLKENVVKTGEGEILRRFY